MAHFLNNSMKYCIANFHSNDVLQFVVAYFRATKRIVEDANRCGWNQYLPDKYSLIQEVERRFKTRCIVT